MGIKGEEKKLTTTEILIYYFSNIYNVAHEQEERRLQQTNFEYKSIPYNADNMNTLEQQWLKASATFITLWKEIENTLNGIQKHSKLIGQNGFVLIDFNNFPSADSYEVNSYLNAIGIFVQSIKNPAINAFVNMNIRDQGMYYIGFDGLYLFLSLNRPFDKLFGLPAFLNYSIVTHPNQDYSLLKSYKFISTMREVFMQFGKDYQHGKLGHYHSSSSSTESMDIVVEKSGEWYFPKKKKKSKKNLKKKTKKAIKKKK